MPKPSKHDETEDKGEAAAPMTDDGGPGSHSEGQSGGAQNDPASGGVPEAADDEE